MRGRVAGLILTLPLLAIAACTRREQTTHQREGVAETRRGVDTEQTPAPTGTELGTRSAPTPAIEHSAAPASELSTKAPTVRPNGAPSHSGGACAGAPAAKAWLTDAGCVAIQRCPGVPGPCAKACVPFPKQCNACASCECVSRALCGHAAAAYCRGHEVVCAEP
jgi:hypothetical protein